MAAQADNPMVPSVRFKCSACYKQYKKKEHLVEHMRVSFHSVHQPKCAVCKKHCRSFDSLREHLTGPLSKVCCANIFLTLGCNLCMNIFDSSEALTSHKRMCHLSPNDPLAALLPSVESKVEALSLNEASRVPEAVDIDCEMASRVPEAVAIDCEMVGAGTDGYFDVCARVCLIDESENVIFHAYVQSPIPITDYRYEITGLTEEHLRDAMPIVQVQEKIQEILSNGESSWRLRLDGGKARLLVGHSLDHDLDCLKMYYPDHMLRDTAKYHPLMRTNLVSHSLKYLTKMHLGYDIQSGTHDPYEDCVAVMRIYKRMCAQSHPIEMMPISPVAHPTRPKSTRHSSIFASLEPKELEKLSPDELFAISRSDYKCWCFDTLPKTLS